ncbi:hypothetical protein CKAH01_16381 [Colletotrichum kahawae]|uniref:Uncharacterized protein n=1 Tax=Colletotrichum kahawae TaxID=34407 RepID=A0AAD9YHP8_COLKA|nr:hypothetical protein CKAH01_16381 [Colletotrichum kahawae]
MLSSYVDDAPNGQSASRFSSGAMAQQTMRRVSRPDPLHPPFEPSGPPGFPSAMKTTQPRRVLYSCDSSRPNPPRVPNPNWDPPVPMPSQSSISNAKDRFPIERGMAPRVPNPNCRQPKSG